MRRPALGLVMLVVLVGSIATAAAQPSPYGIGDERAVPAPAAGEQPINTGTNPVPLPWAQPPADGHAMREPQQLSNRPSGFWTSNRPAVGGAYRWRLMGVGLAVLALTMFFVLRLLIRTSRAARLPTATAIDRR
jgi:hypothetical protein